ncbi:MAG: 3-hydroxyacyl-CoA dehydrogenase [Planctomycetes bacterium]|nr:3-hydroxyacyl-CoA dehydrogenase [Planctomycetota bacterium]
MSDAAARVKRITVVGSGTMGLGIAQVAAMGGFETVLFDIAQEQLDAAMARIEKNLAKGVELGKVEAAASAASRARLSTSTDFEGSVRDSDLMIEAVPEKLELKRDLFARADAVMAPGAVLASNTSGLSITAIGEATKRPDKVIGMHFFNPVHIMKLIEIIRSKATSDATFALTEAVSHQMGKETVEVNESAGFVTSRVNALIGNEAFRMWEAGIASPEDIDKALKLGLNHPMGPFELVDLVGLDVRSASLGNLHEHLGETYRPCPIILDLVRAGRLGKKVGHGVYRYDDQGRRIPGSSSLPERG